MLTDYNINETLLTDLQCFGSVDYYRSLVKYDVLLFEQYEHYKKGSYSNRYYVAGPNGVLLLTVPLLHARRDRSPIKDLKICNRDRWQPRHWKSLTSAYKRSPWFDFLEFELEVMYNKEYNYLLDWNLDAFEIISRCLQKRWTVKMTDDFNENLRREDIVDERHRFMPSKNGMKKPKDFIVYHQVFEDRNGFSPGLSILDLLFCEGTNAVSLLT